MWRPERLERRDRPSAAQASELEAVDRLIAAGPDAEIAEEHAPLAGIILAVRDDRPSLRPGFVAELDARLLAGFPRRQAGSGAASGGAPKRSRRLETRHWLAGLGTAATLAAVAVVLAGETQPSRHAAGPVQPVAPAIGVAPPTPGASRPPVAKGTTQAQSAAPSGAAARASLGAGSVPSPAPVPPAAAGGRAVQRDAELALIAQRGHVQQVADRAIATTDRLGGILESSNVALDDQGGSQASLELRVASTELDHALAALSALAHVSSRSQNALDITDATVAARRRLAESLAERHALLRQLAQAGDPNLLASIHAQLGLLGGRIGQDQAQLQTLLKRGGFAHLRVTIGEDQHAAAGGGSNWTPDAALDAALAVLEGAFAILVIALAGLAPAAALGVLAWRGSRPLRRRRREDALTDAG